MDESGKARDPISARTRTVFFSTAQTPASPYFPARPQEAGAHQREEMVAAASLEEPDPVTPRRAERFVPIEPKGVQGLPAERELGAAGELQLPRGHAQLPEKVDG